MGKKLFVGNLPWSVSEDDLRRWIVDQGYDVEKVEVLRERDTDRSRGFGFLHFATDEAAAEVLGELNDVELEGRQIHLEVATDRGGTRGGGRKFAGESSRGRRREDDGGRGRRGREW
jgi:RNA recognition motif-containing protein